jgi:hypothetical protein
MITTLGYGYGDSETWGGLGHDHQGTAEQLKQEEIEADEDLTTEAIYAYLDESSLGDLTEKEYSLLDSVLLKMPDLIKKSVSYYADVLTQEELKEEQERGL